MCTSAFGLNSKFKFQYDNTLSLDSSWLIIFVPAFKFQYDNTLSKISKLRRYKAKVI